MNKLTKFFRILITPEFIPFFLQGVPAGIEHEQMLRTLSYATLVDIGANRGQFSLVSSVVNHQALIYAFEPLSEPANIFRKIFAGNAKVKLVQCAVGPEDSQAIIHVSKQDDSSSILPITERQYELFPGTQEKEVRKTEIYPLHRVLSKEEIIPPALLKIDVQGYEQQVLQGSESLLSCFHYIYVECSFYELYQGQALAYQVIDYLQDRGYILSGIYNLCYDSSGIAIQGDFLFTNENSNQ